MAKFTIRRTFTVTIAQDYVAEADTAVEALRYCSLFSAWDFQTTRKTLEHNMMAICVADENGDQLRADIQFSGDASELIRI